MADGTTFKINEESYAKAIGYLAAIRLAGPKVVIAELNAGLAIWGREIQRHMPIDNGLARASIQIRAAAQDESGRISGAVGSNLDYLKYLELGGENARGLIKAVSIWKEGMSPIIHWAAKDMGIQDLQDKFGRTRSGSKRRATLEKQLAKANNSSTEEFAPPFRGSWPLVSDRILNRLRTRLVNLLRTGKIDE
ncbi:MAG: hypothetical protein K8U03_05945 [Planctomycetia bacterium]|nr:hypothetical protein [Planctomycetia bacterium]